ncbi:Transmembrane protein 62 [Hypsibius exemplaris]|uniref:Transmembrane protein 62 n=1 Tax=Hypsibius exemplaris TaxID=2072580 RepID=A0A9X6NSB6_HYPEX|nr:Transmembrane protein 62 [Hypsibius exemplaris]
MKSVFKALLVLAVPGVVISSFIMFVLNFITISQAVLPAFRHFEDPVVLAQRKSHWQNIAPRDSLDHLVWFLQITDLHVSEYVDGLRITQLEEFCTKTVDAIRPAVVIASGDLTDAKTNLGFGSAQREWEWKEYSRIIRETRVTERTTWLDIRGNHELTRNAETWTSYHYVHKFGPDSISFIGVDACPDPGFRRPFNFFGVLTEEDMRHLEALAKNSRDSNVTVWFGHYPTSVISSAAPGIANVMSGGVAYLSGHLHTLGGLLPELYAMQKSGTLELELGDWKDNRLFRLMAVDHDLFSFTDVNFNDWPMGIITNPKNVRFYAPVHEPLDRISRSTHVRVLAFSPRGIRSVEVQLPDEKAFKPAKRVDDSPLFILPWDVSHYAVGTHTIRAKITDNGTVAVREIVHDFRHSRRGSAERVGIHSPVGADGGRGGSSLPR